MYPDDIENAVSKRKKWIIPILGMSLLELIFLVAAVMFIRTYVFQLFRVSGPSMCPTLNQIDGTCQYGTGELIFVNQFQYSFLGDPERDDIVVFKSPIEEIYVIKRVLGVPGDTVKIKQGKLYLTNDEVTDELINEPYLDADDLGKIRTYGVNTFVVPDGKYLLLGDNRDKSQDGRHCYSSSRCPQPAGDAPFVDKADIRGKAMWVMYPFDLLRKL